MSKNAGVVNINGKKVQVSEHDGMDSDYKKQQVFIIGSKGIPALYGGFETFVEKLTEYQVSNKIHYHVSRIASDFIRYDYNGASCFNVKVPDIGASKAIFYDLAALKICIDYCKKRPAIRRPIFYILACRIGPFIGHYKKAIKELGGILYVNPDGHEWQRKKWIRPIRKYWKISEEYMVKHADLLICDSINIEKYIHTEYIKYHPKTTYISYGSETRPSLLKDDNDIYIEWLKEKGVSPYNYYLVVGRFVPENNFECMIREFLKSKSNRDFVIITTTNDKLLKKLEKKLHFKTDSRIKFVGTVYNQELLKKIRENAYGYFHGHEVGGTNPSLLEALGSTNLNLLLGVSFNKEVGKNAALYWNKKDGDLAKLIDYVETMDRNEIYEFGNRAKERIKEDYSWEPIVSKFEATFLGKK